MLGTNSSENYFKDILHTWKITCFKLHFKHSFLLYSQSSQPVYPLLGCTWFAVALIVSLEEFFQQKEALHCNLLEKPNKKISGNIWIGLTYHITLFMNHHS